MTFSQRSPLSPGLMVTLNWSNEWLVQLCPTASHIMDQTRVLCLLSV